MRRANRDRRIARELEVREILRKPPNVKDVTKEQLK